MRLLEGRIGPRRGAERRRGSPIISGVERVESPTVGEEGGEVLGTLPQDALPLRLRQLNAQLRRQTEDELLLQIEELSKRPVRLRPGANSAVTADDRCRHADGPVRRNRSDALYQPLGPQQTAYSRRGTNVGPPTLPELQLVEQRADLHALEEPEAAHQRQIGHQQLGEPARQRLEAGIAGDRQRQHRDGRGLRCERGQCRFPRQGQLGGLGRLRPERHLGQRSHGPDTARARVLAREVRIRRKREVVPAAFFLTAADDHRTQRVAGCQRLARVRDGGRRIASSSRHEGGRKAEADVSVAGLLCCLGFERGDFSRCDGREPWSPPAPPGAGHHQAAYSSEQVPATSQRRGLPPVKRC